MKFISNSYGFSYISNVDPIHTKAIIALLEENRIPVPQSWNYTNDLYQRVHRIDIHKPIPERLQVQIKLTFT